MMEESRIRKAVVAGQFYPSLKEDIFSQIESFIDNKAEKCDGLACVLPHAGYMYSGKVAVETISRLKVRKKIILLGPNHTGYGARFSLMSEGVWMTPLGQVKIAEVLAKGMLSGSKYLKSDHLAHDYEHSL
ncbi:MAG: AmmeMemoRadiSam system protein B, partial [Candidatus Omnitrophica bacterium]|nr:AmmeMemoRadiSam system protein B [Candidatus Omnitrophota bacterium]